MVSRIFFLFSLLVISGQFSTHAFAAKDLIYTPLFSNLAIRGYDTVAYFKENKALEGESDYEFKWQGATWRFSNAENLDLFRANPEKYAPQYGGYCGWAVAHNKTASIEPDKFDIHDGKLYLSYSAKIQDQWLADKENLIVKADKNWPGVLD